MPKAVTSVTGFVRIIEEINEKLNGNLFFRGHSNKNYDLKPAIMRNERLVARESLAINQLVSESPNLFLQDRAMIDRLVRAQHYGLPTRLLDLTSNPLVALYFACKGSDEETGRVIVLKIDEDQIKYSGSDTVSCLANLSLLGPNEQSDVAAAAVYFERELTFDDHLLSRNNILSKKHAEVSAFYSEDAVKRLVQFIKEEKPYFENRIFPSDLQNSVVIRPRKNNERIVAQSGAFILVGTEPVERTLSVTISIDIASSAKPKIIDRLNTVGINEYRLFPDPERITAEISARLKK